MYARIDISLASMEFYLTIHAELIFFEWCALTLQLRFRKYSKSVKIERLLQVIVDRKETEWIR